MAYECTNEECPEFDVPKWGIAGVPASEVMCGGCGRMSLVETDDEPDGDKPPYSDEPPDTSGGPQPEESA